MPLGLVYPMDTKKKIIKSLPERFVCPCFSKEGKKAGKEAPQCICIRGSFTLEAAVVFPMIACLFVFLLFFFRVMMVELAVQKALEDTGRTLSVLSSLEQEGEASSSGYFAAAQGAMYLKLKDEENIRQYVAGGAMGVSLADSGFLGDYIFLKADYFMRFPVGLLGKHTFWIHQQARFRKWTGYHPAVFPDQENAWVYITETGSVYHEKKSCPYLDLSISEAELDTVGGMRNKSGHKYYPCGECGNKSALQSTVYITDYGNKYHSDLGCSGLKRTIYQIRLSEIGGRRACSKCWK